MKLRKSASISSEKLSFGPAGFLIANQEIQKSLNRYMIELGKMVQSLGRGNDSSCFVMGIGLCNDVEIGGHMVLGIAMRLA